MPSRPGLRVSCTDRSRSLGAGGLSRMKTSDGRGSYPSPLRGLRRASRAHGWLAQILYLGQSGGGSHNGSRACGNPHPGLRPTHARAKLVADPARGRDTTSVTAHIVDAARSALQFRHLRSPIPGHDGAYPPEWFRGLLARFQGFSVACLSTARLIVSMFSRPSRPGGTRPAALQSTCAARR
jgi:hypothetical protein